LNIEIWPNIADRTEIDCLLAWRPPFGFFANFLNLKAIFSLGAGVDHLFEDPNLPKNISITRIIDPGMAQDMAQYASTAVLNIIRNTKHWASLQKEKRWDRTPAFDSRDKTVGVMGLGFLGSKVASTLQSLGINTVGWSRSKKEIPNIKCYFGNDKLQNFLNATDILICLLPRTPETENVLNKELFNQLKDAAYLINISRGEILVEEDLISSINSGKLSGATLDVFRTEPLPSSNPFWSNPKITVTPHISAVTNPKTASIQLLENYRRLQSGENLKHTVSFEKGY